jgi:hypothetical protein
MMMVRMASLACALILCLSGSALAQQDDAGGSLSVKSLYDDCKGRNFEFCDGFLLGVARGLEMLSTHNSKFSEEYCPPHTVDPSTYRDIFISWAERSQFWKSKPYDGVLVAFWIAWFCYSAG